MPCYPSAKKRSRRAALAPMIGRMLVLLSVAVVVTSCQNPPDLSGPVSPALDTHGLETTTAEPQVEILIADQARVAPDASAAEIQALVAGNNAFAFDLYQAIRDSEENLLYSPYSISQALAMLYAGAQGETARQMAETLHFTLPQERLHSAFNALERRLVSREPVKGHPDVFTLHIANALWGQEGLAYRDEFLTTLAQDYGAGVHLTDLRGDPVAAVEAINRWGDQETRGRIPKILDSLSSDAAIVLANAIYFNAEWQLQFGERNTREEPFYRLDGRDDLVPMMHQTDRFHYTEGEGYQIVELPYVGRTASMVIILPAQGQFREVEQYVSGEWMQAVVNALQEREVILTMPRFGYEAELPLEKHLPAMGMPEAFARGSADLTGILDRPAQLCIGDATHKAFVEVDEKKTEAVGLTVERIVEVSKTLDEAGPVVMTIDRPFIFIIRDVETSATLFVGRVMAP